MRVVTIADMADTSQRHKSFNAPGRTSLAHSLRSVQRKNIDQLPRERTPLWAFQG